MSLVKKNRKVKEWLRVFGLLMVCGLLIGCGKKIDLTSEHLVPTEGQGLPWKPMVTTSPGSSDETQGGDPNVTPMPTNTPTPTPLVWKIPEAKVVRVDLKVKNEGKVGKTYVPGKVSISSEEPGWSVSDLACQARAHGNTTYRYYWKTKVSIRISLNEKKQLCGLGTGSDKDYILLSDHVDGALLRPWFATALAQNLKGIPFVPDCRFAEVYVDGNYKGLYYLIEKVKESKHRVNLNDKTTEADAGFLLELDGHAVATEAEMNPSAATKLETNPILHVKGVPHGLVVKSKAVSKEQLAFIDDYIERFTKACNEGSQEDVEALADIDSIVDMYILQEFMKNEDVGFSSFYISKDTGGKLIFNAPWDFDLSCGINHSQPGPTGYHAASKKGNSWFRALWECEWFRNKVKARWNEVSPKVRETIDYIDTISEDIRPYVDKNTEQWHRYGKTVLFEPSEIAKLSSYDAHIEYLKKWLNQRYEWFSKEMAE